MKIKFIFGTAVLGALLLARCFNLFDPSSNRIISSIYNFSKNKQAILFSKGGNATTGGSLQVSVKTSMEQLDSVEVGNTFIVDDNHGKAWLRDSVVRLSWRSDTQLVISYDKRLRIFTQAKSVDGVRVVYCAY